MLTAYHLTAGELNDALKRIKHAISKEPTRYYLNGVYVHSDNGNIVFVATDGHRLARVTVKSKSAPNIPGAILPLEFVNAAIAATNKRRNAHYDAPLRAIAAGAIELLLWNAVPIKGTAIDGTFPDYKRVIPQPHIKAECDRESLLKACNAAASFHDALNSFETATFVFEDDSLTLKVDETQPGDSIVGASASISIKLSADSTKPIVIGFNARYVADILKSLEGKTVEIGMVDPGSPTTFCGTDTADSHAFHVLMPTRV